MLSSTLLQVYIYTTPTKNTANKPLNHRLLAQPGPTLRRSFCALIAQNHQHSSGRLAERYAESENNKLSSAKIGIFSP